MVQHKVVSCRSGYQIEAWFCYVEMASNCGASAPTASDSQGENAVSR
jgi:hypothetical protein